MAYQPRMGTSGGQGAGRWDGGHPNPSRTVQPPPSHLEPNGDGGSEDERVDVEDGNGGAKRDEDDTEDESE